MDKIPITIFWFRRDLRLQDNHALYQALQTGLPVQPIFIFDTNILDELEADDVRVSIIYDTLKKLNHQLQQIGSCIDVRYGKPLIIFQQLIKEYNVQNVYFNKDYEPYARERDKEIYFFLIKNKIGCHSFKDHVIFERNEILKADGKPYTVFTPYSKVWKGKFEEDTIGNYAIDLKKSDFHRNIRIFPSMEDIHFKNNSKDIPSSIFDETIIKNYDQTRDYPALQGTTKLSIHLRFGTISIRHLARITNRLNEKLLSELIWRDFYHMILFQFPKVVSHAFKPDYDKIVWRNSDQEFNAWCNGETGYPIVDAGMRELNATGYMHNRVRMITASFLTKHLLIDWRWGESYFAKKLLDFDLAANNGGWQWATGSGCDAAPYFRIFNPTLQQQKYDPQHTYIKKWVPEWNTNKYPLPIVEHDFARKRCLEAYTKALKS